ncbi:MAG: dicarboxylate/amino acid:cation symporter [Pirellulales bacterium]
MPRLALHWQILLGVVIAAAIGVTLNITASTRETRADLGAGRTLIALDSVDRVEIKIVDARGEVIDDQQYVVDPAGQTQVPRAFLTLDQLRAKEPAIYRLFYDHARSTARTIGDVAWAVGDLFLRLLKMIAVPLVITSLATGVMGMADAGRLRSLFGRTMLYYVASGALAICTGVILVNLIRPGELGEQVQQVAAESATSEGLGPTLLRQLRSMIPENPFQAVAQTDFLGIITFTLAFGIFAVLVGGRTLELLRELFQAGFDVMMRMTMAIIKLAPFGVFALMLYATATQGHSLFQRLAWYLLTVALGLAFHAVVTLPLFVYFFGRRNPLKFAKQCSPALLTAFSSASSSATLPLTMDCVENRAGIDNRIGSFVLPLGATLNMDGTGLFEVVAVLFIAQMDPNINLTVAQQFIVAVTALLAGIGTAGIPSAGLVMMVIVLQAVGMPTDRVGLILAVDRILDMCRTSVNVWSDMCGCAVVARYETFVSRDAQSSERSA